MQPVPENKTPLLTRIDYKRRIYRVMNYIHSNITQEDISLAELSGIAAFSPFHFHRIFKAVAGENVAEYTRRLRLESAANRLLAYPEQDITALALACGFSSSQNFAKAFRLRYNISPSGYRKRYWLKKQERLPSLCDAESSEQSIQKQKKSISVTIRELPVWQVATIRRLGISPESCMGAFSELLAWTKDRLLSAPDKLFALYWDNPEITPLDKCCFDCCLSLTAPIVPADPVFVQKIGGGIWALCRFETKAAGFGKAWEAAFQWLVESGYECRPLPCAEIYYNDARQHPEGKWQIDIAIPLKQS